MTCASSDWPPISCSTLARRDLRRVPLPAAMITMAKSPEPGFPERAGFARAGVREPVIGERDMKELCYRLGGHIGRMAGEFCQGEQLLAEPVSVMSGVVPLHDEISGNALHAQLLNRREVRLHLFSVLFRVPLAHAGGNRFGIDQRIIKNLFAGAMVENCLDVVRGAHIEALISLSHQVADE